MRIVRWIIGGLLLLVFSAFTGIVWLAYHEDRSSVGEAPLVRADAEPYRQAPDKRGGLAVLNEGSSIVQALDRGPEPAIVERILPPPRPAPKSPADISRHQFAITPDVKPDPVRANDGDVARPTVVAREVTDGPATGAAGGGDDSATLPEALASDAALPAPRLGRVSRRVRSFPITPRVDLRPDEKAQHWLLSVSASDRAGLLYGIARVLAEHQISVELAKISTLGERVEDTFLLQGVQLQHQKTQIAIERELLEGLEVQ